MADTKTYEEIMAERDARKAAAKAAKGEQHKTEMLKLAELEVDHGDDNIAPVWTSEGLVVIRTPTRAEMARWREAMWAEDSKASQRQQRKAGAGPALAEACVIYPDKGVYKAMCERRAGIADAVAGAAVKLGGVGEDDDAGKS